MIDKLLALETFGIKLGLENIQRLCEALEHPERRFISLHIGGTNGKGSVAAMVHAGLAAAGIRAGRYTSPHLAHVRERFVVDGDIVTDAAVDAAAAAVLACADRLRDEGALLAPPTFFEATTAMAFHIFRQADVKVAVIEVGLGGRFDATNVISPLAGAITTISLDHQEHLGQSIEEIAYEKAGIIKPGMTVVVGQLPEAARRVIQRVADERGATIVDAEVNTSAEGVMHEGRAEITIETPHGRYGPVTLGLRGEHQIANAIVAVRMLETAAAAGINIPLDAIVRGLQHVTWPGRLELLALRGGKRVLLDAAHNPEGARALRRYLHQVHPGGLPLVVGVMRDKDVDGILRQLLPSISTVVATAAGTPRALPAAAVAARVSAIDPVKPVRAVDHATAALADALELGPLVCVAGSIFLIGEIRDALERRDILDPFPG